MQSECQRTYYQSSHFQFVGANTTPPATYSSVRVAANGREAQSPL